MKSQGFFKPLRRKLGVVTLAIACVVVWVWMRSYNTDDCAEFTIGILGHPGVHSSRAGMTFVTDYRGGEEQVKQEPWFLSWHLVSTRMVGRRMPDWLADQYKLRTQQRFLCTTGDFVEPAGNHRAFVRVGHWSIIAPLCLLSGFLLLAKPNTAKRITVLQTEAFP